MTLDPPEAPTDEATHAVRVLAGAFEGVTEVHVLKTWGPTVVVEATVDGSVPAVVLKASSSHDMLAEAAAARTARAAGVPVPRIIATGRDALLPGRKWVVFERAQGVPWESLHVEGRDSAQLLRSLARHLRRLHDVHPEGYGWIDASGAGTSASWREWLTEVAVPDIERVGAAGFDASAVSSSLEWASAELADELDARPVSLVHGDLGDREVIVDPGSGAVTAIVDWGDAVAGDPLYEFSRFVGGGPADDSRPARFRPTLVRHYGGDAARESTRRLRALYDAHNAVRNAAWAVREEPGWVPDLLAVAARSLQAVGDRRCRA